MAKEKKNNGGMLVGILIGIIMMLVVGIVLLATGTVGFKQTTNSDNGQTNENNQINNSNTSSEEYDAEAVAKEKMPVVLSLSHQMDGQYTLYAYCGNRVLGEKMKGNFYYSISKDFKTLNELKDYLNTVVSKDLYDKYFLKDSEKYLEQNGNLYCAYAALDGLAAHYMSEESINKLDNLTYTIFNKTSSSFDAILSFTYSSEIEDVTSKEYKYVASFIKENDTWLISSFGEK